METTKVVDVLTHLDTGVEETNVQFSNATEVRPGDLIYRPADYVIGKNDMLQISIVGLTQQDVETQIVRRVSESGKVSLRVLIGTDRCRRERPKASSSRRSTSDIRMDN